MSTSLFHKQTSSPVETRRSPTANTENGTGTLRSTGGRSISSKFRNMFRKNSTSPSRTASTSDLTVTKSTRPPKSSRSRSPKTSPEPESPRLRAPIVVWPFGKKSKSASTTTPPTATKSKSKLSRKNKSKSRPGEEISRPMPIEIMQNSTVSDVRYRRSADFTSGSTERLSSSVPYEMPPTRGFRDFTIIDHTGKRTQVDEIDPNMTISSSYISEHPYTSSMDRQDNSVLYVNESSWRASNGMTVTDQQESSVTNNYPGTATQILASKTPILPQNSNSSSPRIPPTKLNQQTVNSSPRLTGKELRSTTSTSSTVMDSPKLNAPRIGFGSVSSKGKTKRGESESRTEPIYYSTPSIGKSTTNQSTDINRSRGKSEKPSITNENFYSNDTNSSRSNVKYPFLTAIVEHHLNRVVPQYIPDFSESKSYTNPERRTRFEASTTTSDLYDQHQPWPVQYTTTHSTAAIHRLPQDGYIRPLTPQKHYSTSESNTVHGNIESIRSRSPPAISRSIERDANDAQPTYRSSTTIYTRDKHYFVDGGEVRTWSVQENRNDDDEQKYNHSQLPVPTYNENDRRSYRDERTDDHEEETEDRYVIAYEYDRQQPQYSYEIKRTIDQYSERKSNYSSAERLETMMTDQERIRYSTNWSTKEQEYAQGNSTKHV